MEEDDRAWDDSEHEEEGDCVEDIAPSSDARAAGAAGEVLEEVCAGGGGAVRCHAPQGSLLCARAEARMRGGRRRRRIWCKINKRYVKRALIRV